jgi:hypothetical protein
MRDLLSDGIVIAEASCVSPRCNPERGGVSSVAAAVLQKPRHPGDRVSVNNVR